jgi:predicted phage terminase large subunit-like protein
VSAVVPHKPEGLRWVRYVDLAISEKARADYNATVAMAMDKEGNVYLRDMIRVRGWYEFKEQLIAAMTSDLERGVEWAIEGVAFQSLAFQELLRDARLANVAIREIKPEGDKVARARPLQTRARGGKLKLVGGAWVNAFVAEALDFPKGRHDDQIDSASGGLEMIANRPAADSLVSFVQMDEEIEQE